MEWLTDEEQANWLASGKFFSNIVFVEQRWCEETRKYTKTRVVGADQYRNNVKVRCHGMDLPGHRHCHRLCSNLLDPESIPMNVQSKRDLQADMALEREARDKTSKRFWWTSVRRVRQPQKSTVKRIIPSISKIDLKSAYFQLGYSLVDSDYAVYCVYDADSGRWRLLRSYILSFGNRWSAFSFCCYSALIQQTLARVGIITLVYIDDILLFSPPGLERFIFDMAFKVISYFGCEITDKPDGVVLGLPNELVEVLGLDYKTFILEESDEMGPHAIVTVTIPKQKRETLLREFSQVIQRVTPILYRSLTPRHLARVTGMYVFILWNATFRPEVWRLSRLWTLSAMDQQTLTETLRDSNERCLLKDTLEALKDSFATMDLCMELDSRKLRQGTYVALTDACLCKPKRPRRTRRRQKTEKRATTAGVGGLLIAPDGQIEAYSYYYSSVPAWTLTLSIMWWELLAVLIGLVLWAKTLKDKKISWSVDNSGAGYVLINKVCHCRACIKILRSVSRVLVELD